MRNSQSPPPPNYGAQASPMSAPGPTAPPAANPPIDWSQRAPLPPAAGGVNPSGPGQYAPSAGGSQLPSGPPARFTGDKFKQELGSGIKNGLDPAGLFHGKFGDPRNVFDPAGVFGGNDPKKVKGTIDPTTGTYTATNYGKNNAAISAAATEFLRTGNIPPSMKDARGMYTKVKRDIKNQLAHGGAGGGAWQWGTPSAGAPTVIPGQGPVNWGGQPPPPTGAPPPGNIPPPTGAPPPAQGGWVKPAPLPASDPYKAQVIQTLRAPNAQSRLTNG